MRVYYTLTALRQTFNVTFLTSEYFIEQKGLKEQLAALCDELIVLPAVYNNYGIKKQFIKFSALIYLFITGLKFSNYLIGDLEFSPRRIRNAIRNKKFDMVLFEYWHAHNSVSVFKKIKVPCILDMHNILLQSHKIHFNWKAPSFIKKIQILKYQKAEESSWNKFDAVIAINKKEYDYVSSSVPSSVKVFYIAMGIDLAAWPYVWQPATPKRLAYYGGMGSQHNKQNALYCVNSIMPLVWEKYPVTEFWIIGSEPDNELLSLQKDLRVHVTGYQQSVKDTLKHVSVLLCPWHGKYGFRSRIIEVMATGVTIIASHDSVDGMELEENKGIYFAENASDFAAIALKLLDNEAVLARQSKEAREQVEKMYSFESTYQSGVNEIKDWLLNR